jgi:hypothetical protein
VLIYFEGAGPCVVAAFAVIFQTALVWVAELEVSTLDVDWKEYFYDGRHASEAELGIQLKWLEGTTVAMISLLR